MSAEDSGVRGLMNAVGSIEVGAQFTTSKLKVRYSSASEHLRQMSCITPISVRPGRPGVWRRDFTPYSHFDEAMAEIGMGQMPNNYPGMCLHCPVNGMGDIRHQAASYRCTILDEYQLRLTAERMRKTENAD